MERETKAMQVGAHTVTIKTFLTGREVNKLKEIMQSKMNIKTEDGKVSNSFVIPGTYLLEQELAALEVCLVTLDGSNEDLVNRIQDDLTAAEYNQVVVAVNEMTKDLFTTAK